MVFYLKYRPRRISELDSLALQERLEKVLKGNLPDKIPHAFLFTGPKGLGKTSTARILAKAINCTNRRGAEFEPCNKCSSCKSIDVGSNLDILEIDGASNRGIDEIRDLREKIRLSPVSSIKKIYIIDEVHMLTPEAFNALLKTLEEPPNHAEFILCTTEAQKIPETIASRSFVIKFNRATDEDLVHSFKRILKGEGIKADDAALFQIAKLSDGSFRDGAKILEEISLNSKNITEKSIQKDYNFQTVNKSISELLLALKARDAKKGIKIISDLASENIDFKIFTESLIGKLHESLITQAEEGSIEVNETRDLITMLVKSHVSIKYAVLPQLPLELAIVEWCSRNDDVSSIKYQVLSKIKADSSLKNEEPFEKSKAGKSLIEEKGLGSAEPAFASSASEASSAKEAGSGEARHDNIIESLIESVKKENFSIAGVLRGCKVEKFDKKTLIISTEYKFHKERLSDKKVIDMLEKKLGEITGEKTKVMIELKE